MSPDADPGPPSMSTARVAARMANAAQDFLDSLNPAQRATAQWLFPSDEERQRWYYTPTDHGGLALQEMRPAQQRLAFKLLATGLSRPGYVTAAVIIGLENVLDELEGWGVSWNRDRGRDPGLYYLRIFGEPGAATGWSWRFGGHHVSVHHLLVAGVVNASTPLFLGADPASAELLGGSKLRPLAGAEDLGRELVGSLDAEDLRRAVISAVAPFDLVGANRPRLTGGELPLPLAEIWRGRFDGELGELVEAIQKRAEANLQLTDAQLESVRFSVAPKGIPAAALSTTQQELLRNLVGVYVARLPDDLSESEMRKYAGELIGPLHFAWAGGIERGVPHYYRVQGSRLLIEYDNTQRDANHAHSVWRDPEGDFGMDVLGEHHRRDIGSSG
jgi:hypothetical protein